MTRVISLHSLQFSFELKYNIQDGNKFKNTNLKGTVLSFLYLYECVIAAAIHSIFVALD